MKMPSVTDRAAHLAKSIRRASAYMKHATRRNWLDMALACDARGAEGDANMYRLAIEMSA